jgi:PAS domain S-box-containing protein
MNEYQQERKDGENQQQDVFAWQVIEALGQGVTIVDGNGRFTYVNPAYARMVGRPPEELIGKSPLEFTHPDDRETLQQARQQRRSNQFGFVAGAADCGAAWRID